jgi:hypothetical protein
VTDWAGFVHLPAGGPPRREIPDVALDKHTLAGRRRGRGWAHFFDEGTQLSRHVPQDLEHEYREQARRVVDPQPELQLDE